MLIKTIGMLFVGTRYGIWGMSLIGIPLSMILMLVNMANGWAAIALFFAALLLSCGIVLLLIPKKLTKGNSLEMNRYKIGAVCITLSILLAGGIYLISNGFPDIDLLFI